MADWKSAQKQQKNNNLYDIPEALWEKSAVRT